MEWELVWMGMGTQMMQIYMKRYDFFDEWD
jgi:hypothetical protein